MDDRADKIESIVDIAIAGTVACKLTKLGRTANPEYLTELRLNEAQGRCSVNMVPTVGKRFAMIADTPNPKADVRLPITSEIQKVEKLGPNKWRFETVNSVYELEKFDG